jgi:hypothetical protein
LDRRRQGGHSSHGRRCRFRLNGDLGHEATFSDEVASVGNDDLAGFGPGNVDLPLLKSGSLSADDEDVAVVLGRHRQPIMGNWIGVGLVAGTNGWIYVEHCQVAVGDGFSGLAGIGRMSVEMAVLNL